MNQVQVLNEIEKAIDKFNPRDILLSRNQSEQYEKSLVLKALGGRVEPLHQTAPLRGNNRNTA